jgi:hypothetical protein
MAMLGALAIGWATIRHVRPQHLGGFERPRTPLRLGLGLLSMPFTAMATLFASYPYLWRNPIDHTQALVDYREWGMDVQGAAWPQIAVDTRLEALRRVGIRLGDDFTVVERVGDLLGASWAAPGLEVAVAVAGLLLLLAIVIRDGLWSAPALGAAVLVSEAAVTIYGLRVDWARYHLPLLLLAVVGIGVLGGRAGAALRGFLTRPLRTPSLDASRRQVAVPIATLHGGGE